MTNWLRKYKEGGVIPKRSTDEVPTRNTIPSLPPLDQGFINHITYSPEESTMRDVREVDFEKSHSPWQDKVRNKLDKFVHSDINGNRMDHSNSYADLLVAPIHSALNLTEPNRAYKTDENNPWYDRVINAAVPVLGDMAAIAPFVGPAYIRGNERIIREAQAIPGVLSKAKNLKSTLSPGAPLATEEANLLKNTRLVGSILHGGGEESTRLESILSRANNMSDRDLKALTGMNKAEIQSKIESLKTSGPKKQSSINLERPERQRRGSRNITDYNLGSREGIEEYLSTNNISLTEEQIQNLNFIAEDVAVNYNSLRIPNTWMSTNGQNPFVNATEELNTAYPNLVNKKQPLLVDKLYNKWSAGKRKGFLPETAMPVTESLIPSLAKNSNNNPAAEMVKAYKKVENAPKGKSFIPAHSLSEDSYPMSMRLIQKAQEGNLGDINFHGHMPLNTMGFPAKAELNPSLILKEQNSLIDKLNKGRSEKIPYGYIERDNVYVPQLTVTKKQYGGWLNNY